MTSLRAVGLLVTIEGLPQGTSLSDRSLAEICNEGRATIRTALRELEAEGRLDTLRRREGNTWVRSEIQPVNGRIPNHGSIIDQSRMVGFGTSGSISSQSMVGNETSGSISDHSLARASKDSLSKEREEEDDDGSRPQEVPTLDTQPQREEDDQTTSIVTVPSQIPWTEVHLLKTWFNVTQQEQVDAWRAAWTTAVTTNGEGDYDVQAHLSAHLAKCHEEKRDVRAGTWLRFLIEDRVKWFDSRRHEAEVREQRDNADGGAQWALDSLRNTPHWN